MKWLVVCMHDPFAQVNLVILIIVTVIVIRAKRKQDKNANLVM